MLTPGQIFQKRRRTLRKPLTTVSLETKIQEKYLRYLEEDEFIEFDSPVFASGFVKIYSDYLGLDVDKMLALYRRASLEVAEKKKEKPKPKDLIKNINWKKIFSPINIIIIVTLVIFIFIANYINTQYQQINRIPELIVREPENGEVTNNKKTKIIGITDKNAILTLNNTEILNNNGSFEHEVSLDLGNNIFEVTAINTSDSSLTKTEIINIKYEEKKEETKPKEKIPTSYQIYLDIVGEPAWIKLSVDDTQKYAQVLNIGKTEVFKFTKNIEIVSGKPNSTKVFINNKEYKLKLNTTTGVASLSCEKAEEGEILCNQ